MRGAGTQITTIRSRRGLQRLNVGQSWFVANIAIKNVTTIALRTSWLKKLTALRSTVTQQLFQVVRAENDVARPQLLSGAQ